MSDYSFTEKWAAIPWLNQDTSQAIAPYVNNTVDIQKIIDEEKRKERTKKFMRGLLTVGLLGGGLIGGAKLLSAAQARQAAQAKKILAKRIGKGVGSLGLLGAAIFGLKHLNSNTPTTSTTPSSTYNGRTIAQNFDIDQARDSFRQHRRAGHNRAREAMGLNEIRPAADRLMEYINDPRHRRNAQIALRIKDIPEEGSALLNALRASTSGEFYNPWWPILANRS